MKWLTELALSDEKMLKVHIVLMSIVFVSFLITMTMAVVVHLSR